MTRLDINRRTDDFVALAKRCQDTPSLRSLTPLGFQDTSDDLGQSRKVCLQGDVGLSQDDVRRVRHVKRLFWRPLNIKSPCRAWIYCINRNMYLPPPVHKASSRSHSRFSHLRHDLAFCLRPRPRQPLSVSASAPTSTTTCYHCLHTKAIGNRQHDQAP
eukprot:scaffold22246_cov124-Isochrysis_galbana.AAC.2